MRMCLSLTRSRRLRLQAVLCTRRETQERADLRVWIVNENKMVIKTVQYVRFPGGPPPEYWTRPWLLSFGDRTGSGVSNQV